MTNPITPPPELVHKWALEAEDERQPTVAYSLVGQLAAKAAQWGADQELAACCEVMRVNGDYVSDGVLRAIRRPRTQTLKEQALNQYAHIKRILLDHGHVPAGCVLEALEALPDD